VDVDGFVYVSDQSNNMVRKIDPATGQLTTRVGRIYNEASGKDKDHNFLFYFPPRFFLLTTSKLLNRRVVFL